MSVKGRYRGPGDISTDERPLYVAISADAPEKADACLAVVCEIIQAAGPEPPPLGPIVCTKAAQRAALARSAHMIALPAPHSATGTLLHARPKWACRAIFGQGFPEHTRPHSGLSALPHSPGTGAGRVSALYAVRAVDADGACARGPRPCTARVQRSAQDSWTAGGRAAPRGSPLGSCRAWQHPARPRASDSTL